MSTFAGPKSYPYPELQPRQRAVTVTDNSMEIEKATTQETPKIELQNNTNSDGKESFPVKLMHILQLIDTKEPELAHIISWQPNGTTFRIHDKKLFEKLVKQRGFFNQKSYSSFRRQLNLWGFKKIGKRCAADCGVYGHPLFLKENPSLCHTIARSGSSKTTKQVTTIKTNTSCAVSAASTSNDDAVSFIDSTRSSIATEDDSMQKEYQFYGQVRKFTLPAFQSIEEDKVKIQQTMPTVGISEQGHDTFMSDLDCFDIGDCFDFDEEEGSSLNFFANV
ncbi:hypothetical protein CTEN210_11845 [Chaetoceros tenuissimus]|uniref:HSF-type DNA-binding domain-containing protein n=1 Tax=Chaetoceros tenuissimus TaxID=426638 RepID=A0AAD3H9X1_9STRA|nr:hypothetical protein CTEN210_11845 [Chaetoceros tenuissimus]